MSLQSGKTVSHLEKCLLAQLQPAESQQADGIHPEAEITAFLNRRLQEIPVCIVQGVYILFYRSIYVYIHLQTFIYIYFNDS